MNDIETLVQEMNYKYRSAKDLQERVEKDGKTFSKEERQTFNELIADGDALELRIAELKQQEEDRRIVEEKLERAKPQRRSRPGGSTNGEIPEPQQSRPQIEFTRHSKLTAFTGPRAEERAFTSGQWFRANFMGDAVASRWCREAGIETRASAEHTNTTGGYLVPSVLETAIIDLKEQFGVARQLARIWPMGSENGSVPVRTGGQTAYFTGEGVAGTESTPSWKNIQLTVKKLMTYTLLSSEIAEDAVIDLGNYLAQDAAYALSSKEDDCYFNGDGTSTYGGIQGWVPQFEAGTGLAAYVNATSGTDSLNQVDAEDLAILMGKCPQYARTGAAWVCSQTAADVIFSRLMMSAGGNTIATLMGSTGMTFLGYPVVVSQKLFADTADTAGNNKVMLMFGNFQLGSIIGSRREMRMALSTDYKFLEDQTAIKVTERLDMNIHGIGDTTNAGPVVALIGNT
jgi:HK97 family phage major capsid protein